ncbi:MAG: response regulator transcription factor [Treponema sp.]|nr:response regulator transcription factor [Treponema sp.]
MAYKILIADDENEVIELLKLYLEKDGHIVYGANDGMTALGIVSTEQLDCALLDVMMPELNGFQLLKKIREKSAIPVLMLTARVASSDKVLGLELGADDYVTKPFDPLEVVARIKAHVRRYIGSYDSVSSTESKQKQTIVYGNFTLDTDSCSLQKNGTAIEVTSTEFKLLKLFFSSPGRVFTKEQLTAAGWEQNSYVEDNSLMVALSKLRSKMGEEICIKNIRGLGYRLEKKNE